MARTARARGASPASSEPGSGPDQAADERAEVAAAGNRRTGRRAGPSDTKSEIACQARALFAQKGYDGASIRMIATASGVDPALIAYFFGSKSQLFAEVLELPLDPSAVVPRVLAGPIEEIGARLAAVVIGVLDNPDARNRVIALLRSASGNNEAAEAIRRRLTTEILEPIVFQLGMADAELRAALVMSQISGLTVARHVIGLEVLTRVEADRLSRILARTLQRYLAGALD